MKKILCLLLFTTLAFSQTDRNGNPVFNSVSLQEQSFSDYTLSTNYYPLKNNIDNRGSSVFVAENPSLEQIITSAIELSSNFYLVLKDGNTIACMLVLGNLNDKIVLAADPQNPHSPSKYKLKLKGDITQDRAEEILHENYDQSAKIENGTLYFNKKKYTIIHNADIIKRIVQIVDEDKLYENDDANVQLLTQDEIRRYITEISQEGGELDFFTEIKGKEYDGVQIKPRLFTTKLSIALYKWGRACYDLGLNTSDDALVLFAEIKGRELSEKEVSYITAGFNKDWEK